ncbi:MAG: ATP-binding cassette domain-containing protein [Treponema sp.]|jgi:ABC-type bacteriocin/lantibiotic exporter with double-glycine peptidase domain|nr:ATP-binding cassette domain-containing protein [Treponema sp.]
MNRDVGAALEQLTRVNARLSSLGEKRNFEGHDNRIGACMALCHYFKTEAKIPPRDIRHTIPDLAAETLYLSNLRYKEVELGEKWWKQDGGAMLAFTAEGKPLALLPHNFSGYSVYDPETSRMSRLRPVLAKTLAPLALAVFRPFPYKVMRARDVIVFMARENIGKELAVMTLFSLLASIVTVIPPIVSAQIFDMIVPHTLRVMLFEVVLVLLCFGIANTGFTVVTNISISRMITKIGLSLEGGVWDRILSLKLPFLSRYTTGELLQKIQGIDRLKNLFSINTLQTLVTALFSFVNIIVLFRLDAGTAGYVLLMFLGLFVVCGLIAYRNFEYHRRSINVENRAAGFDHQALEGIQRIKASRAEGRVFREWSEYEAEKRYLKGRIKMLENLNESVRMFFQFGSAAAVFYLISRTSNVEVGVFIAFVATFLILHKTVQRLLKALDILPEAAALVRSISPVFTGESEYNPEKIIPRDMTGSLEVNHLNFHYGEFGVPVLRDISFRVEEGQSLGIVGSSGCGKSTLLKALLGFYPPAGGKIFYGGYDLNVIELRYLRRQLGVVLQDGSVPMGKIHDIIADGDPSVSREDVLGALEKTDMLSEVEALSRGPDTPLERCAFSGAELQRLMLARAMVKPRRFVFFDEPAGFQENVTRQRLLEHIYAFPATRVIVTRRPAVARRCDFILLLDRGVVVKQGSFEDVLGGRESL